MNLLVGLAGPLSFGSDVVLEYDSQLLSPRVELVVAFSGTLFNMLLQVHIS